MTSDRATPRRNVAEWIYRKTRHAVWNSPLARWPAAAQTAVRAGIWARRWLKLAPAEEALGMAHGHQMWFGPASECYLDMTQGTWEPGVTRLFEATLRPGMTVVDAGAHIGYFSLLAAKLVGPGGSVYAFEPAPANYDLLVRNVRTNGYENIITIQQAVSDAPGSATFHLHADSVAHSLRAETFGKTTERITVNVTSLDRWLAGRGWPPVHLVKLDVEGAEAAALRGMTQTLARNPEVRLIIEYIPHVLQRNGEHPGRFLDTLRGLGFQLKMITDDAGLADLDERLAGDPNLRTEVWCERR